MNQKLTDFVESHKKINRPADKLKGDISLIMETVDQVNSANELEKRVGDELLSQIFLPSWVKPFVFPIKVSLLPGFQYKDLVLRPAKIANWEYKGAQVANAANRVAQYFKTTAQMVSADQLRGTEKVLSEVKFCLKGMVEQKAEELFYPIPMVVTLADCLGDEWANMQSEKMVDLWLARAFSMEGKVSEVTKS